MHGALNPVKWNYRSASTYLGIGFGALTGAAVGIGTAVGFSGMLGITATSFTAATTGFTAGATVGAAGGATSGFVLNTSNSLLAGENFGKSLSNGLNGAIIGGITGGVAGGIEAIKAGKNFWTGKYTNRSLVQKAATIAEKNVGGKGAVAGTKKHEYATELLKKYQDRYGHRQLYFKESQYDVNGRKYILDVLDKKNKMIYDWKFGYPNKTPIQLNATPQMQKYRELWRLPSEVIKP